MNRMAVSNTVHFNLSLMISFEILMLRKQVKHAVSVRDDGGVK